MAEEKQDSWRTWLINNRHNIKWDINSESYHDESWEKFTLNCGANVEQVFAYLKSIFNQHVSRQGKSVEVDVYCRMDDDVKYNFRTHELIKALKCKD